MEERKHIDRVFQEKFKDFEATPREVVWDSISARLQNNQRKKRVLPIWYKMAGVAAILALFINYATGLFKSSEIGNAAASTLVEDNTLSISLASHDYTENMIRSSIILQAIMQHTYKKQILDNQTSEFGINGSSEIVASSKKESKVILLVPKDKYTFSNYNSSVVSNSAKESTTKNTKSNLKDLPTPENNKEVETLEIAIASKKLRVSTMAAPIFYDNFGSGTSIDAQFANNESSGELSISYGINLAYQISEKIKLRSGISKVDLSYNTKNIAFTAAVNPTALNGINYADGNIPNYRIENRIVRPFNNLNASAEFNRASLASPTAGYINQKLGFIEVPLEIEYVLVDKKFGVNIIGGGSTLFLDDNMISLNSSDFSTDLGEANNLNTISFSTNIGVGIDYKISPQFELNLEPIFKYQLNTFSKTTGNVNPYYFGVYSGFSFKF